MDTDAAGEELVGTIRAARRRLADDGPAFQRDDGDFEQVSLPSADGDALRDLLVVAQAGAVIEVGLAYGASALAIEEALAVVHRPGATHVVVDAYQEHFGEAGWQVLVGCGVAERCRLLRRRSQLALAELVAEGFVADAAFVDGSHLFHNVFVDLAFLDELVRPGGVVVLDDCHWLSVATAVDYFETNLGWREASLATSTRLRAWRLPDPRATPRFEDFRPFGRLP